MFAFMYLWWFWLALALVSFLPVGYGWGYRGWGVPYPTYVQRRRMRSAESRNLSPAFDHQAWGRFGDFVWVLILCDVVFFTLMFWRR